MSFFFISSHLELAAFDSTNKIFIAVEFFSFSASFAFLSAALTSLKPFLDPVWPFC